MLGALLSAGSGIIGSLINASQNQATQQQWYEWEKHKEDYNSIPNQMNLWKEAGLNPNSFGGNFQPVTGSPPQPTPVGDSIARGLSTAGSLWQQKEIAKMSNEVQKENLELQKQELEIKKGDAKLRSEMHQWNTKLAKQAFDRGDYQLAMDILDYAYAFATYDDRKQMFKNEVAVSNEYSRRYPDYLAGIINNYIERNKTLSHGRKLGDQRLVLDYNKLYDDNYWKGYGYAQDESKFSRSLNLRSRQHEESVSYHSRYLDYLYSRQAEAIRERKWKDIQFFSKEIAKESQKFKVPSFSPKYVY